MMLVLLMLVVAAATTARAAVVTSLNVDDRTTFAASMPDLNQVVTINVTTPLYNATGQRPIFLVGLYSDVNVGQNGLASCSNVAPAVMHLNSGESIPQTNRSFLLAHGFGTKPGTCVSSFPGLQGPQFYDLHDSTGDETRLSSVSLRAGMTDRKVVACEVVALNAGRVTLQFRYNLDQLYDDCAHRGVERTHILGPTINGHQYDFGMRYRFTLSNVVLDAMQPTLPLETWRQTFVYTLQNIGDLGIGYTSIRQNVCSSYDATLALANNPMTIYNGDSTQVRLNLTYLVTYTGVPLDYTAGPAMILSNLSDIIADVATSVAPSPAAAACYGLAVQYVRPPLNRPHDFCVGSRCDFLVNLQTGWIDLLEDGTSLQHCMDGSTPPSGASEQYDILIKPYSCYRRIAGPYPTNPQDCSLRCEALCGNASLPVSDGNADAFHVRIQKTVALATSQTKTYSTVGAGLHASRWASDPTTEDTQLATARCALVTTAQGFRDAQCGSSSDTMPSVPMATDGADMAVFVMTQDMDLWDAYPVELFVLYDSIVLADNSQPSNEISVAALGAPAFRAFLQLFKHVPRQMYYNMSIPASQTSYVARAGRPMLPAAVRHVGIDGFSLNAADFFQFFLSQYPDATPMQQGESRSFSIALNFWVNSTSAQTTPDSLVSRRRLLSLRTQETGHGSTQGRLQLSFTFTKQDWVQICGCHTDNSTGECVAGSPPPPRCSAANRWACRPGDWHEMRSPSVSIAFSLALLVFALFVVVMCCMVQDPVPWREERRRKGD